MLSKVLIQPNLYWFIKKLIGLNSSKNEFKTNIPTEISLFAYAKTSFSFLSFFIGILCSVVVVKKNNFTSTGHLEFSLDTLVFDTVFTTIGSTTEQFKIITTIQNHNY